MDLVLLFAVLELIFKVNISTWTVSLDFLAAGIAILFATDAVFMWQSLDGTYLAGGLVDLGWPMGYVLIGLAGMSQADAIHRGSPGRFAERNPAAAN